MAKLKIDNTGAQYIRATKKTGGSTAPTAKRGTDLRCGTARDNVRGTVSATAGRGKR